MIRLVVANSTTQAWSPETSVRTGAILRKSAFFFFAHTFVLWQLCAGRLRVCRVSLRPGRPTCVQLSPFVWSQKWQLPYLSGVSPMSYIPLQISASEHPVLFINSQASLCDLHAVAGERMRAAKDAIESLACMDLKTIDIEDLTHFFKRLRCWRKTAMQSGKYWKPGRWKLSIRAKRVS